MTIRVACEVRPQVANRTKRSCSKNDPDEFYKRSPVFDFSGNSGRRPLVSYSFEAEFTPRTGIRLPEPRGLAAPGLAERSVAEKV